MAHDAVVTDSFSEQMIAAGAELLERLDRAGLQVRVALWLYFPDAERWRLLVATPYVRLDGPRKVYKKIQSLLGKTPEGAPTMDLDSIMVVDIDAPIIQLLRSSIRTGDGIHGVRFTRNVINGTLVEDAYLYRIT